MFDRYSDLMNQKEAAEREAYGPRPERAMSKARHLLSFRIEPELLKKLRALAKIEEGITKIEKGDKAGHISVNAEIHYLLVVAVNEYESKNGAIPAPDDAAGIARHVRARTK